MMIDIISPGAIAVETTDLAHGVDLLILVFLLRRFPGLPLHILSGNTVIDVMNYRPPIDGSLPAYEGTDRPASAIIQDTIPEANVVKIFNHLGYHKMEDLARRPGSPGRIALGLVGNNKATTDRVMDFVNAVGFGPVRIGPTLTCCNPRRPTSEPPPTKRT